ncbi:MAG: hypothetical protein GX591_13465 [Planctomycetes bacterium]|nr:hypothetical protein [Planctomycetota bacterium]
MIQYEQGDRFAQMFRDRAGGVADRQKHRAADKIGDVGGALDRAAERLDSEEDRQFAQAMHKAADSLRNFASSLADRDLDSMRAQAADAARNHPVLFLGAAFIGGLAVARFLRSEPPQQRQQARPAEQAEPFAPADVEEPVGEAEVVTAWSSSEEGTVVEPAETTEPSAGGPQEPL